MARKFRSIVFTAVFSIAGSAMANPGFWSLGTLNGYDRSDTSSNVSHDGQVVAGSASHYFGDEYSGFRWTEAGGINDIGHLPSAPTRTIAVGVSGDGNTILGVTGINAMSWTQSGGLVDLGRLTGTNRAAAFRSSFDGSVIVGVSGFKAFQWSQPTGMVELPSLPSNAAAQAYDVSADGSIIIGQASDFNTGKAVKWSNGVIEALASWGSGSTEANGLSADGSIIAGRGYSDNVRQALVWKNGTVQAITPATHESWADGISSNGRYVVGTMGIEAFIWSEHYGLRYLAGDLDLAGVTVPTGWTIANASGVYEDASGEVTVTGTMVGPFVGANRPSQAFVARYTPNPVPEPLTCLTIATGVAMVVRRRRR